MKPTTYLLSLIASAFLAVSCIQTSKPTTEEIITTITAEIDSSTFLYDNLEKMTTIAPARMSGSQNNATAVDFVYNTLKSYELDSVWLQPVKVPYWIPGETQVYINLPERSRHYLTAIPLGTSAGTKGKNITAQVVEIKSMSEIEDVSIKGKILFINMVMDDSVNTYGVVSNARVNGPNIASKKGAVATIVRSLTPVLDDNPHTGVTRFEEGVKHIPAVAISTLCADNLSSWLQGHKNDKITINSTSELLPDAIGNNVVAELRGSETPDNIILLSAHIDSWFNSQGAQDNAASCVMAMEVLRVFKQLGIKTKNTIRIITYQDEEMTLSGMREYARIAGKELSEGSSQKHLYDLELDTGAGAPGRFIFSVPQEEIDILGKNILPYLQKFGVEPLVGTQQSFRETWPLTEETGACLIYHMTKSDNYFQLHHSPLDNFDTIDFEQYRKSVAAIAGFVYLLDSQN